MRVALAKVSDFQYSNNSKNIRQIWARSLIQNPILAKKMTAEEASRQIFATCKYYLYVCGCMQMQQPPQSYSSQLQCIGGPFIASNNNSIISSYQSSYKIAFLILFFCPSSLHCLVHRASQKSVRLLDRATHLFR